MRYLKLPALILWTLAFAVSVTVIDWVAPFGGGINVPWPQAWLFYPAIAFVAEVVFHVVPLTLLVPLHQRAPDLVPRWLVFTAVMLIEPVFQAAMSGHSSRPAWAEVLTFLHILAINAVLVALVMRRGLVPAYALRVAYYGYWHVLYGAWRLSWLGTGQ